MWDGDRLALTPVEPVENNRVIQPFFYGLPQLTAEFSALSLVFQRQPRAVWAVVSALCVGLLAFGLYLQHVVGLEPCPMCIVQRYTMVLVALAAGVGAWLCKGRKAHVFLAVGLVVLAGWGAFVAARQSFLQWYPPEISSCGRDFYGMIEAFPLQRVIPMVFRGSGDCSAIDWTFLGLTIANWSFLSFALMAALALGVLVGVRRGN
jgi:protein dithiol:quinone oxidoreductase